MKRILGFLERGAISLNPEALDFTNLYILVSPKHDLMGFNLGDIFLILNTKYYYSFRTRLRNLEGLQHKFQILKPRENVDVTYLSTYFDENQDNPYAIQHVLSCIKRREKLKYLTQFPPLFPKKNDESIIADVEKLAALAQPADMLFSFNRNSRVSQLIRNYDRSPWSHCAMIAEDKSIVDVTVSGVVRSHFEDYANRAYDLALYRYNILDPRSCIRVSQFAEQWIGVEGFNWYGVFRLLLRNKFRIPYSEHSVADFIYSNKLQLIGYA